MVVRVPARPLAWAWLVSSLVACLAGSSAQAASVWKWRDANGRITVSDQPPSRDIPEADILERPVQRGPRLPAAAAPTSPRAAAPAASAAGAGEAAARVDAELQARRRAEEARAREAAKAAPADDPQALARKRENCQRARAMLANLESGQRMARLNDKGERVVLDDAARAQEARRAREVIASECA
jgi:hypothetical protein